MAGVDEARGNGGLRLIDNQERKKVKGESNC